MSKLVDGDSVLTAAGSVVLGAKGYSLGATIAISLVSNLAVGLLRRYSPATLPSDEGRDQEVGRFFADLASTATGWYVGYKAQEPLDEAAHDPLTIER